MKIQKQLKAWQYIYLQVKNDFKTLDKLSVVCKNRFMANQRLTTNHYIYYIYVILSVITSNVFYLASYS